MRKTEPLIYAGHIRMFLKENSQILAYERFLAGQSAKLLVFTNFYGKSCEAQLPEQYQNQRAHVILSNYDCLQLKRRMTYLFFAASNNN